MEKKNEKKQMENLLSLSPSPLVFSYYFSPFLFSSLWIFPVHNPPPPHLYIRSVNPHVRIWGLQSIRLDAVAGIRCLGVVSAVEYPGSLSFFPSIHPFIHPFIIIIRVLMFFFSTAPSCACLSGQEPRNARRACLCWRIEILQQALEN